MNTTILIILFMIFSLVVWTVMCSWLLCVLLQWLAKSLMHVHLKIGSIAILNLTVNDIWLTKYGLFSMHAEKVSLRSRLFSRDVHKFLVLTARDVHIGSELPWTTGNLSPLDSLDPHQAILRALVILVKLVALQVHGVAIKMLCADWMLNVCAAEVCLDGSNVHSPCLLLVSLRAANVAVKLLHSVERRHLCLCEVSLEVLAQASVLTRRPFPVELVCANVDHFRAAIDSDQLCLFLKNQCRTVNREVSSQQFTDFTLNEEIIKCSLGLPKKYILKNKDANLSSVKNSDCVMSTTVHNFKIVVVFVSLPRTLWTNSKSVRAVSFDISICELRFIFKKVSILLVQNFIAKLKVNKKNVTYASTVDKLHVIYDHTTVHQFLSSIFQNYHILKTNCMSHRQISCGQLIFTYLSGLKIEKFNHAAYIKNVCIMFRPPVDVLSFTCGLTHINIHFLAKSYTWSSGNFHEFKWEIFLDDVCLCSEHSNHVAVPINIARQGFLQKNRDQSQNRKQFGGQLVLKVNNVCINWSPYIATSVLQCFQCLYGYWKLQSSTEIKSAYFDRFSTILESVFKCVNMSFTNVKVYFTGSRNVCFLLRMDDIIAMASSEQQKVVTKEVVLLYLSQSMGKLNLCVDIEKQPAVAHVAVASLVRKGTGSSIELGLLEGASGYWSATVHRSLLAVVQEFSIFLHALIVAVGTETADLRRKPFTSLLPRFEIYAKRKICLSVDISPRHKMELSSDELTMSTVKLSPWICAKKINITIDKMEFLTVEGLIISTNISDNELVIERQSFEHFLLHWNTAWIITADLMKFSIPHEHSFPEALHEDLKNVCCWLRQVHKKEETTVNHDGSLPFDLNIKVRQLVLELADEPFEMRLLDNYMLLKDEQKECFKRSKMLETKIMDMHAAGIALSISQVENLHYELSRKNAEIYVRRSKHLRDAHPARSSLLNCSITDLKLMLLADPSQQGTTNVIRIMMDMDDRSPWSSERPSFSVLSCRAVSAGCKDLQVQLRDFPRPLGLAKGLAMWGTLVAAQMAATPRERKRRVVVNLAAPWAEVVMMRNMHPLKLYHDLSCEIQMTELSWGPSLAPVTSHCTLSFEKLLPVSKDPSRPLRFWDKLRLLVHGRLTAVCHELKVMLHSSLDPYNTSDRLQIQVNTFAVDLTDGKVVCEGAVSAHVRTQSHYDDCCLLQSVQVRLSVGLLWGTLGDPCDHHSVAPCAPDRLPQCCPVQEHDSYRAFRSQHLDLCVSVKMKSAESNVSPCVLVYGRTLRWLKTLGAAVLTQSRPIRRGAVFGKVGPCKITLLRHLRNVQLAWETCAFRLQYWTSFAKQDGFSVVGGPMLLSSEYNIGLVPHLDGLNHLPSSVWNIRHMSCDLQDILVNLISMMSRNAYPRPQDRCLKCLGVKSGFVRVGAVHYRQESTLYRHERNSTSDCSVPKHHLVVHSLKGLWNKRNRDIVFAIITAYTDAQKLQRNLSRDLISNIRHNFLPHQSPCNIQSTTIFCPVISQPVLTRPEASEQFPAMLKQLLADLEARPVVHCEMMSEPSQAGQQNTRGLAASHQDDVIVTNWLMTFVNSQVVLKGCESKGFVIASAAKAEMLQRSHAPTWRHLSLVTKTTWTTCVEGMQYYATISAGNHSLDEDMLSLDVGLVEEPPVSGMHDLPGTGQSVGEVITATLGAGSARSRSSLQLQRIVSRCRCEIVYVAYGQEAVDPGTLNKPPTSHSHGVGMMENTEDAVNCLTFAHFDLDICTNSQQYVVVLDILRNLVLHVDLSRRQACDHLQKMRFRWQLLSYEDQHRPLLELQAYLRTLYSKLQQLKKEAHIVQKSLADDPCNDFLMQESDDLELKVREYKKMVSLQSEELHMMVVCYKEAQMSAQKKLVHSPVTTVRFNEIFLKHVRWQLTGADGRLGIADLILWNFLYVNTVRSDNSGEHLVELEYLSIANLLPREPYQKVLFPTQIQASMPVDRMLSLRVICKEKAPVAGITVIEHFEINVAPLTIGLTKKFFYTILKFFFPEPELHSCRSTEASASQKCKSSQGKFYINIDSSIEEMKARAQHNKLFVYTKVTAVPVRLSYLGSTKVKARLVVPTLQYHNMTWTWLDLLLAIKSDCRSLIFTQAIKQKLKMKKNDSSTDVLGAEHEEDEVMHLLHGHKHDTF